MSWLLGKLLVKARKENTCPVGRGAERSMDEKQGAKEKQEAGEKCNSAQYIFRRINRLKCKAATSQAVVGKFLLLCPKIHTISKNMHDSS
jgi:hypothetical protein